MDDEQPVSDGSREGGRSDQLHLRTWLHPGILSAAAMAAAAGFAQFGVSAALGDVAAEFGEPQPDLGIGSGLAGTTLGAGLALIRLASLGALPLSALADHLGRKRLLITTCAIGLLFTTGASLSPSFWWFVVIFALGRPLLSTTNAVAGVIAAEETRSSDRSRAIALVGAAYGVGAGATAIIRGAAGDALGFRGLFALAIVPLVLLPLITKHLEEPERFTHLTVKRVSARHLIAAIPPAFRSRLYIMCMLWGAIGFVSGPANMFLFYYGERVQGLAPATMALVVVAAGPSGLIGLLLGRWGADTIGRRTTAMLASISVAGAAIVTYNFGRPGVIAGYLLAILVASAYAPASGALSAELFPTSIRGTVAGYLTALGVVGAVGGLFIFGLLIDLFEGFGAAAVSICVPVMVLSLLYLRLPETRGLELEESAPEPVLTRAEM